MHKHVACNSFSVSLQTVEELRKAPRFVVGIGNKIFEQSGFFASMVNSFSLVLQNLWMLSQCSLYSATLLCQACLSFMWPRSMPSNRAIFPSLPFGIFPCVSSNRRRRWTSDITNWMKLHVSIESLNLFFSICFERSIFLDQAISVRELRSSGPFGMCGNPEIPWIDSQPVRITCWAQSTYNNNNILVHSIWM